MRHGSLFSGIGGFDLAAEWMGWENMFHCDNNEFCQKILKYHFPNSVGYADITTTDFSGWAERVDIVTGGFPCQPYSQAGKRKGKEDERHLWPEMLRAIREIQPRWVVGENVSGLLNWSRGLVLDEIKADLEAAGFEVFPPLVLPACAVNAPHRRDRVWIVAHNNSIIRGTGRQDKSIEQPRHGESILQTGTEWATTHSDSNGFIGGNSEHEINTSEGGEYALNDIEPVITTNTNSKRQSGKEHRKEESRFITEKSISGNWENFPTQSPLCGRDDGLSSQLVGITFPKHLNESIKGYGNSIVPQVVFQIFKTIESINVLRF